MNYLNQSNKKALEYHSKHSDGTYNAIIKRVDRLAKDIAKAEKTTFENDKSIQKIKRKAFEDIAEMLEKDLMILIPLMVASAYYAYNNQVSAVVDENEEEFFITQDELEDLHDDILGDYMRKAITDNIDRLNVKVNKLMSEFRNGAKKDVTTSLKRFLRKLKLAFTSYKERFSMILWQETRRVTELFRFLSIESLVDLLKINFTKTWITMSDDSVRNTKYASHVAMQGKEIDWKSEFKLVPYGNTKYPRGSGIPSQDINCRCVLKYKILKGVK